MSHKEDIEHLREVTGGSIEYNKTRSSYSIVLKDLPSSKGANTE